MRHRTARRLLALAAAAAALVLATAGTAPAAEPRSLTAPVGSTKGSVVLPYLEQENVSARVRVHRAVVRVARDGTSARAKSFAAEPRRHELVVRNGCRTPPAGAAECPPPVEALTVTLNGEVVLSTGAEPPVRRVELPAGAFLPGTNQLIVSARGVPGSAARVWLSAVRSDTARRPSFLALQNATQMESR